MLTSVLQRRWAGLATLILTVAALTAEATPAAALVARPLPNGNFEAGNLSGWRVNDWGVAGDGWSANSGTVSPVSQFDIPAPPQGSWQAVVDQVNNGSHLLYRDIVVDQAGLELVLTLWYRNRTDVFFTPNNLNPFTNNNQQVRVDLIRPDAWLRTMSAQNVLATVFRTQVGDPASMEPRQFRMDLSRFVGQTVRLRIAEVDNQNFFQAGVDAVRVVAPAAVQATSLPAVAAGPSPRATAPMTPRRGPRYLARGPR
ncbi:MAG TPA: hypothetical protein VFJ97_14445 [Dermatophilaceae bacterium]|nr:hypothetical protein [Dermatophilaceae bacterium]